MTPDKFSLISTILEMDNKNIWILHNETGEIKEIFGSSIDEFVVQELKQTKSLSTFYDFSSFDPSKQKQSLPEKKRFTNQHLVVRSKFPISVWKVIRLSNTEFFGRIAFIDMAPNVFVPGYAATVFIDNRTDTIFGIKSTSYEIEPRNKAITEQLIGRPVSDFLSPTPKEFNQSNVARFSLNESHGYKSAYYRNFEIFKLGNLEEISELSCVNQNVQGLHFNNTKSEAIYLTPLVPINTRETDFIFTVECCNLQGEGPFLSLGGRHINSMIVPDDAGYLAGSTVHGNKVILKKYGYIASSTECNSFTNKTFKFTLVKFGKSLLIYQDETELIAFFDNDFLFEDQGYLSIGVRNGRYSVIKSISIHVRKSNPLYTSPIPKKHIVTLKSDRTRFYNLERFYTTWLSNPEIGHVAGYFLSDITELQMKTVMLDKEYQAQVKRGKELSELLKQYQKDDDSFSVYDETMVKLKETARIAAESEETILIEGETGTGKEILANYIHLASKRCNNPLVKVDCATVPATLIEDYLFGHEKGAFTGATQKTTGMLEKADKGTLFLDEIANLPLEIQAKFLQFFNDFTIIRIGGTQPIRLNVRCIVASNENLEKLVREGKFREDLFYRLNVLRLSLPPLRERIEDIAGLATMFLKKFSRESSKEINTISQDAMKKIQSHNYPGNIRELKNIMRHAVIFAANDTITSDLIQFSETKKVEIAGNGSKIVKQYRLSKTSTEYVNALLAKHNGNVMRTAKELGVSKISLYAFMKKRGADPNKYRKGFDYF